MGVQNYTGQELVNGALSRLGGYSNAVDPADMLDYINEGKNELWNYLKGVRQDYFGKSSQSSDNTADDYFGNLATTVREYNLPNDCREVKAIEITTSSYEGVEFCFRDMASQDFRNARLLSNAVGSGGGATGPYYYDILGRQLIIAQYPEQPFAVTLRYIATIADIELNETASTFLFPFFGKLKSYGAKRATLGLRDFQAFDSWRGEWKSDLQAILAGASSRQIAEPVFAQEFMSDAEDL